MEAVERLLLEGKKGPLQGERVDLLRGGVNLDSGSCWEASRPLIQSPVSARLHPDAVQVASLSTPVRVENLGGW